MTHSRTMAPQTSSTLVGKPPPVTRRQEPAVAPSSVAAWRAIGWFGFVLAVVGLADAGLHWYPFAFDSPEWEFSVVAISLGSLPLVTMGMAALLGSFLARGVRWGTITTACVLLILSLLIAAAYTLFLFDVPMALRASSGGPMDWTVRKAVIRTSVMAVSFGAGYFIAAVAVLYSSLGRSR